MNTANKNSKTILVVEDGEDILDIIKHFLELENFTVLTATNGLHALELIKKHPEVNIILLDMKMPVMNGWEFAQKYFEDYAHRAPIIVMTAAADAQSRAKDIGAAGYLEKPFELDDLLNKVLDIIANEI